MAWLKLPVDVVGVVAYYQEYLEALYDCLDGQASITGSV